MSTDNKSIIREKSSKRVANFLSKTKLHKKDFAQMVGVTLSYVYNLIDEAIPFSSRGTTLERIAVVMDILPEDFEEYIIQDEPVLYNKNLEKVKDEIKKAKLSTVDFLKMFERKKRLELVDILRGVKPLPINPKEFEEIAKVTKMDKEEAFLLYSDCFKDFLQREKFNVAENTQIIDCFLECIKSSVFK